MQGIITSIKLFFRVALFKTPPQDLPASESLLAVAVGFAFFVGLLRFAIVGSEYYSFLRILLEVAVPGILVYCLLLYLKKPNRFNQTFAAICGSSAIIYALALPVLPAFFASTEPGQSQLPIFLIVLLDLWSVAVLAYILRHAVSVGIASSISMAVLLVLLTLILIEGISPAKQPAESESSVSTIE